MKKIQYIFSIVILLVIASCGSGGDEKAVNDNTDNYPDADAVYISLKKEYTLNSDGSTELKYSHRLKFLTHMSFNRLYGESFVVYDPNFQELIIDKNQTTMADGSLVVAPDNAYNEVLPRYSTNFPEYNHLTEMVITHTALELDAINELEYTVKTKPGFLPHFMGKENLFMSSPVKQMIYVVRVPKGEEFNWELVNSEVKPEETEEGDFTVYTWTLNDVKPSAKESHTDEKGPVLIYSNVDLGTWMASIMNQKSYSSPLNQKLKDKADKIKEKGKDGIELALEFQKFVSSEFNQFHIPAIYNLGRIRSVSQVFESNGGTEIELANMLKHLLIYAGFEAGVEVVADLDFNNQKACNWNIFKEYLVCVELDGEVYYLNPLYSNRTDYEFDFSLSYIPIDNYNDMKIIDKEFPQNLISVEGELKLSQSKYTGDLKASFMGGCNPFYVLTKNEKGAASYLTVGNTSTIEELKKPFSNITYKVDGGSVKEQSGYYFCNVPMATNGVDSWHMNALTAEKKGTVEIYQPINEKYSYTITLPDGLKYVSPVGDQTIENDLGKVQVQFVVEEGTLTVIREIVLKNKEVSPEHYKDFKAMMDLWNNSKYREIILKK